MNSVMAEDEVGTGGANHQYIIWPKEDIEMREHGGVDAMIQFQKGARKEADSVHGVLDCDLLEIVRDRLKAFQTGEFASVYNEQALLHVEEALMWMNRRVEDRIERNVLGTYQK